MSYTDRSGKVITKAYGQTQVPIYATIVPGDLLTYDSSNYGFKLADQSDALAAQLVAVGAGISGDTVGAALAVEFATTPTLTGDTWGNTNLAAATDIGAPLYIGESGKAQSSAGATCAQVIGFIISRTSAILMPQAYITGATMTLSGNASVGGTLAVTGTSTLTGVTTVTGKLTANGSVDVGSAGVVAGIGTGANGIKLKNLKNAAAGTLSGTALNVEIDIGGTPYYFAVYPTKS